MKDEITATLKAMADPTRREIFHALMESSDSVPMTSLSDRFEISRQGVSKHVGILEQAGLIHISSQGRKRLCIPDPRPLKEIQDWLSRYDSFWEDSLGRLEQHLNGE